MGRLLIGATLALACATALVSSAVAAPAHAPCTSLDLMGDDLPTVVKTCEALIQSGTLQGDDLAEAIRFQGNAYFHLGDFRQAFQNYGRALLIRPNWPTALWNYGNAAAMLGLDELDLASERRAVEIDPNFSPGYNELGTILSHKGDREGALAQYEKAVSVDPKNFHARLNRALTYKALGRPLDAIHDLDALLHEDEAALNATYVSWRPRPGLDFVSVARDERAGVLEAMGSFDEALAEYSVEIARKPDYAPSVLKRAQLVRSLGSEKLYAEALASLSKALASQPDDASLEMEKARLLVAMENKQGARIVLADSTRFEPSADGHFFLDRSYAWKSLEEYDRAVADARTAMNIDKGLYARMVDRMRQSGYLMEWPGLDPDVAMSNALAACAHDNFC